MRHTERTAGDAAAKREEITKRLPEIAQIADPNRRAAVVDIWTEM